MTQLFSIALALALLAAPVSAGCFADYKAKSISTDPLQLHYGVAELSAETPCTPEAATLALGPRLADNGWEMLRVLGVFDDSGLEERKDSAGQFYLRF